MSLLDKLPEIKQRITTIATEVKNEGWIDESTMCSIIENLKAERITIGVVGQMNYGKSMLLNALVFGNNILPSATTPMTASLTYLTYGEESVNIEFYTPDEWKKIEELSSDKNTSTEADAARQLVENASAIKEDMPSLLGSSKKIRLAEIMNYVGEGGKYVPLTKALTISFPAERLKDIDFIDTPGFNDPIASRETRANESLKKADVIIVLLFAQRPFDVTDKEIIFKKLKMAGTGKVLVVVNKYDLLLDDLGSEAKVMTHINDRWKAEVDAMEKESPIIGGIFKTARHIPFSSLMALLGKMAVPDIKKDEALEFQYEKFMRDYPVLKTAADFIRMSKLPEVENEIDNIIKNQKIRILVQKPITSIIGNVRQNLDLIDNNIFKLEIELKNLQKSMPEITEERKKIKLIKKEVKERIKSTITELNEEVGMNKRDTINKLKKAKNDILIELSERIPEKNFTESKENYLSRCRVTSEDLLLGFKTTIDDLNNDCVKVLHQKLKLAAMKMDAEIDAVVSKFIEYESNINDVRTKFQEIIEIQSNDINIAAPELQNVYPNVTYIIDDFINEFIPFGEKIDEIIDGLLENYKSDIVIKIRAELQRRFADESLFQSIEELSQKVTGNLAYLENKFEEAVLTPIETALKDAEENMGKKEERKIAISIELEKQKNRQQYVKSKIDSYEKEMNILIEGAL